MVKFNNARQENSFLHKPDLLDFKESLYSDKVQTMQSWMILNII